MGKYRGLMLVVVIILLTCSSTILSLNYPDGTLVTAEGINRDYIALVVGGGDPSLKTINYVGMYKDNPFDYTYVLGSGPQDDDVSGDGGDNICQTNSAPMAFGVSYQSKSDEGIWAFNHPEGGRCSFLNLPVEGTKGCYYLSMESDGGGGDDDCMGFFIPPNSEVNSQLKSELKSPFKAFFNNDETALHSSSFNSLLPNFYQNNAQYLWDGQVFSDDTTTVADSSCIFTYDVHPGDVSYICLSKDGDESVPYEQQEHRWYICDQEHLSQNTGKYIPITPAPLDPNVALEPQADLSNGEDNPSSDNNDQASPEVAEGWFCVNTDGVYGWDRKKLTCDDLPSGCDNQAVCTQSGYSWDESNDEAHGGKCCGDDSSDYGQLNVDGTKICLPKPGQDLSFTVGSASGVFDGIISSQQLTCGDTTTCWVEAFTSGATSDDPRAATVLTINNPGEKSYDIFSDGKKWKVCKPNSPSIDVQVNHNYVSTDVDLSRPTKEKINGFYCYEEGNHYSWAQCKSDAGRDKTDIKSRSDADGLYTLFLGPDFENPVPSLDITPTQGGYNAYYNPLGDTSYFDFTGYDQIEIYVRLLPRDSSVPENSGVKDQDITMDEIKKASPLKLQLTINGPTVDNKNLVYLSENILGYTKGNYYWNQPTNPGVSADGQSNEAYLHIIVPIPPNLNGISSLHLSPENNQLGLKVSNIYLSKKGSSNPICSGSLNAENSNWLDDFDDADNVGPLADRMCRARFGDNAWLGDDSEVDKDYANCCGDDGPEYYSGDSKVIGGTQEGEVGKKYGCFNGQPIAHGESSALVSIDINFTSVTTNSNHNPLLVETHPSEAIGDIKKSIIPFQSPEILFKMEIPAECVKRCLGGDGCHDGKSVDCMEYAIARQNAIWWQEGYKYSSYPNRKDTFDYLDGYIIEENTGQRVGTITEGDGLLYYTLSEEDLLGVSDGPYKLTYYLFAKPEAASITYNVNSIYQKTRQEITFSCASDECLYPVPPTTSNIRNPHPEQYDLYTIRNDGKIELINSKGFDFDSYQDIGRAPDGITGVLVRRVPKQVLFINPTEEDPNQDDRGFYSCGQPLNIEGSQITIEEANRCQVLAGNFCAPSVSKEGKTQINSWSTEKLERMGYLLPATQALFEAEPLKLTSDINALQAPIQDPTAEEPIVNSWEAKDRTTLAKAVPARNILPNPNFKYSSEGTSPTEEGIANTELPYWTIFKNGVPLTDEKQDGQVTFVTDNAITIPQGYTLISNRIAIENNQEQDKKLNLAFTAGATFCDITIHTSDADGEPHIFNEFNRELLLFLHGETDVGDAIQTYIEIKPQESKPSCVIVSPNLQLLLPDQTMDGLGEDPLTREDEPSRSGVACCPNNGCWNGYACVQEFTQSSFLVEKTGKNNKYRCTKGVWTDEPVKYDWLGKNYGYCPKKEDCFVLSSLPIEEGAKAGLPDKMPIDFYNGETPMCIPDKTFILDHYCDKGNWSTRTSYLASAMLDLAEGEETYSLFCGLPTQVNGSILDSQETQAIFGPDNLVAQSNSDSNPLDPLSQAQQNDATGCYPGIVGPNGLVTPEENTCINKMCVLKKNDGTMYIATSLNPHPKEDLKEDPAIEPNIFNHPYFKALNIDDATKVNCDDQSDDLYQKCQIEGDLIPDEMGIKYGPSLNITLYGPNLAPGGIIAAWESIKSFFANLFATEQNIANQGLLLNHSKNIDGLYSYKGQDGKEVQAVKERIVSKGQTNISATFVDYETDICAYMQYLRNADKTTIPWPSIQGELLTEADQGARLKCKEENGVQRIELTTDQNQEHDASNFFAELTAKLRVQE